MASEADARHAMLRRRQGRLCVAAFEGGLPVEWRRAGTVVTLTQADFRCLAEVLPVGSSNRLIVRSLAPCNALTPGHALSVSLAPDGAYQGNRPMQDYPNLRVINAHPEHSLAFSIVTLMRDETSYRRMLRSYEDFGFNPSNTEFLAIDNRSGNFCDGYGGMRLALGEARARYIIFCHEDIELLEDDYSGLCTRLDELEAIDPNWMIAGVAGGIYRNVGTRGRRSIASRISDRWGVGRRVLGPFPRRVEALDECFLVMPRLRAPQSSLDLAGFHFYGTDLCTQAEIAGGSAWLIEFHVFHHGKAKKGPEYSQQKDAFERKYSKYFPGRTIITSTKPLIFK